MKIMHTIALALALAGAPAIVSAKEAPARNFPEVSGSWLKQGAFVTPANIRLVRLGLRKAQVYPLLGAPHFAEGIGARRWSYLLNFYTGSGSEHITCQLLLQYEKGVVSDIAWRDGQCAGMTEQVAVAEPVAPQPIQQVVAADPEVIAQYVVYFAFDKSDLSGESIGVINQAIARAKSEPASKTIVIGAADRTGQNDYNLALSHRRAEAVTSLIRNGNVQPVETAAKGLNDLAIPTPEGVRERGNRRVVITLLR